MQRNGTDNPLLGDGWQFVVNKHDEHVFIATTSHGVCLSSITMAVALTAEQACELAAMLVNAANDAS